MPYLSPIVSIFVILEATIAGNIGWAYGHRFGDQFDFHAWFLSFELLAVSITAISILLRKQWVYRVVAWIAIVTLMALVLADFVQLLHVMYNGPNAE